MNIKGIITGDIVNSRKINIDFRDELIEILETIINDIKPIINSKIEIYRGDSFQVLVDNPSETLRVAILIRAGLKYRTPKVIKKLWDARVSVGVGEVYYNADRIGCSDGEGFQLSGWGLDDIGKEMLLINTRWKTINEEFKVSTAFADDVISKWTRPQSEVIFNFLLFNENQKNVAEIVNKEYRNVSKLIKAAKGNNIRLYIERFNKLVELNINN